MKIVSVSAMMERSNDPKGREAVYAACEDGTLWVARYAHIDDNPENKMELRWIELSTPEKYKDGMTCPQCRGDGEVSAYAHKGPHNEQPDILVCGRCGGTGSLTKDTEQKHL